MRRCSATPMATTSAAQASSTRDTSSPRRTASNWVNLRCHNIMHGNRLSRSFRCDRGCVNPTLCQSPRSRNLHLLIYTCPHRLSRWASTTCAKVVIARAVCATRVIRDGPIQACITDCQWMASDIPKRQRSHLIRNREIERFSKIRRIDMQAATGKPRGLPSRRA